MNEEKKLVPKLRFVEFRDALDWKDTRLGQLGELVSGLTYSPDDVRETGLLVLRSSNVQNGKIALDDCVYVDPATKGANLSQANDILICVRNGSVALIGKNALIPESMPLCTHGAFMTVFRSKSAKFVFQLFQSEKYQKQVDGDLGATINSINGGQFVKYTFAVPQPAEQQKIADCLSSLDELIAALARKVDVLKIHKKGLMQLLFPREGETQPRLRFPEFRDAREWAPTVLGSIASFSSGGTPSKDNPEYWGGSIPWVSASSMYELHISRADHYVTPLAIGHGTRIAKKGTLLILVRGSMLFKRVPMCIAAVDVAFNQDVKALKVDPSVDSTFLIYQLLTNEDGIPINETGIGAGKIDLADLKKFGLFIPSRLEQRRTADCLSNLDGLINTATQQLETLKTHKKALMQQLFPSAEAVEK